MYDAHKMQPLLAQVPLTVSPFISIPSAVTLPYTFKSVPTSMPPSLLAEDESGEKPRFIVSPGGHAAHPDEIVVACQNLRSHLQKSAEDAQRSLKDWEESVKQRDLAEKRRVAPGWLDRDEKILEPTRAEGGRDGGDNLIDGSSSDTTGNPSMPAMSPSREGEEIDRAFEIALYWLKLSVTTPVSGSAVSSAPAQRRNNNKSALGPFV